MPLGGRAMIRRAALLVVTIPALACASAARGPGEAGVAPEELLAGAGLGVPADAAPPVAGDEVLAVSPEMRGFLDRTVHRRASAQVRLQELVDAIVGAASFGFEFEDRTRTAAETFRLRRGNCLSFSNLFVALAREVGLDAAFQEVDLPPDWALDNEVFVLNRHVNVRLGLGSLGERVVDLNIDDYRSRADTRVIPDARARAHFFNNVGVERLQAGDTAGALACFRTALTEGDRRFSPAWTNLGTLYLRAGLPAAAEAAYRQALAADRGDTVAMSNLARLYEVQGDAEQAAAFRRQVARHRNQNPYYRYQLARRAFAAADFEAAVRHLKAAVRRKPDEASFCRLLGRSYLELGKERRGRHWLARADALSAGSPPRADAPGAAATAPRELIPSYRLSSSGGGALEFAASARPERAGRF
jgi:Flp pilus assembly protein TadD